MHKNKLYFPALDAIRSIACLFVLSGHIVREGLSHFWSTGVAWLDQTLHFFSNGGFGVHVFFVLSGFLISYLLLVEREKTGTIKIKNFYIRRVLRIWPLYFLVLAFGLILYPLAKQSLGVDRVLQENILYHLFFLGNFDYINIYDRGGTSNGMVSILWSVAIEEQFYLLWPWLFFLLKGRQLLVGIFLSLALSIGFILTSSAGPLPLYYHTVSNFLFLASGGLLAYFAFHQRSLITSLVQVKSGFYLAIYLGLLVALIYVETVLNGTRAALISYWLLTVIFLLWLISSQLYSNKSFLALSKAGLLIRLGKYTYGLYMFHRIAQWLVVQSFKLIYPDYKSSFVASLAEVVLCLSLTFIMAKLSYNYLEKPFLALKDKCSFLPDKGSASRRDPITQQPAGLS